MWLNENENVFTVNVADLGKLDCFVRKCFIYIFIKLSTCHLQGIIKAKSI